jgi:hypothetical protein
VRPWRWTPAVEGIGVAVKTVIKVAIGAATATGEEAIKKEKGKI